MSGPAVAAGAGAGARAEPRGTRPKALTPARVGLYVFLVVSALFFLAPLWVMVVTSMKGMPEIRLGYLFSWPSDIDFAAWTRAWATACTGLDCSGISPGFWNSIKITVPSVIVSVTCAALNGYALSFWRFKGANLFFGLLIFGAFVPYQAVIYPLIIFLREVGLFGTLPGIVIIHTIFGMPILTLLFRNFFAALPEELFRAARVDGAGFWTAFFHIIMPMSVPITIVAVILQVTGIWNDFLFGSVFAGRDNMPMTVLLNNIVNSTTGIREYNVNMAATILTAAVPLAVYFVSGRWFVRGIAAGAVKG